MARILFFLTLFVMVLITILIFGCRSTPSPDLSIVWSDDFEDGDTEEWEEGDLPGDEFSVNEGVLSFGHIGGDIQRISTVAIGTWSVDVLIPDKGGTTHVIGFIAAELGRDGKEYLGSWVAIENQLFTNLSLYHYSIDTETLLESVTISEGEKLTGWHHIDITRDNTGNVKVYFDREMVLEHFVDFSYKSEVFYLAYCCEGPGFDNVIIRDKVIEIQPIE